MEKCHVYAKNKQFVDAKRDGRVVRMVSFKQLVRWACGMVQ